MTVLQRVFGSGIIPYIHETGFQATRIITGVMQPVINPFFVPSGARGRAMNSGERLFTTDQRASAFMEALKHTGDGAIPPGTYELCFEVQGQTLNHNRIQDEEYRDLFSAQDHTFSRASAFYIEQKGWNDLFHTHSWISVAGEGNGPSGYVHACDPNATGQIWYRWMAPLPLIPPPGI